MQEYIIIKYIIVNFLPDTVAKAKLTRMMRIMMASPRSSIDWMGLGDGVLTCPASALVFSPCARSCYLITQKDGA